MPGTEEIRLALLNADAALLKIERLALETEDKKLKGLAEEGYESPCLDVQFGPYDARAQLCDDDGMVRPGGDVGDYTCTGHAHRYGFHWLCTSPAHLDFVAEAEISTEEVETRLESIVSDVTDSQFYEYRVASCTGDPESGWHYSAPQSGLDLVNETIKRLRASRGNGVIIRVERRRPASPWMPATDQGERP